MIAKVPLVPYIKGVRWLTPVVRSCMGLVFGCCPFCCVYHALTRPTPVWWDLCGMRVCVYIYIYHTYVLYQANWLKGNKQLHLLLMFPEGEERIQSEVALSHSLACEEWLSKKDDCDDRGYM